MMCYTIESDDTPALRFWYQEVSNGIEIVSRSMEWFARKEREWYTEFDYRK